MTPITKEDRIRVFGSYIGSEIIWTGAGIDNGYKQILDWGNFSLVLKNVLHWSILVTPLENISDEDKLHCYHLHSAYCKYDETQTYVSFLEAANHVLKQEGIRVMYLRQEPSDYLRKKGYTLPFGPYPVEQLIKEGIFKLKI